MEWRAASLADYAALFPRHRSRRFFAAAATQIQGGPAWTLWRDGAPLLMTGLHPFAAGVLELWLMLPAKGGAARITAAVLREMLIRGATTFPERAVIARIDDGNPAGQRMARLAGFCPLDEHLAGTALRTWVRPADAET